MFPVIPEIVRVLKLGAWLPQYLGESGERYVKPILFGSVVGSNLVE